MQSQSHKLKLWTSILFSKRLNVSLYVILPVVFGLTAFASGFIALILVENFLANEGAINSLYPALVKETIRYIKIEVVGFSILGVLAGIGVAYAVLNPLKRLLTGARQVASGNLQESLEIESLEQFGTMGKDFTRVVSSLKQNLIDNMAWGWILFSKSGKVLAMNPGAELILGLNAAELVGQPFNVLKDSIKMEGNLMDFLAQTLNEDKRYTGQTVQLVNQRNRQVTLSFSTSSIRDSDDQTVGVAATFKDLTRSQEITEKMQRTDKLAAMGSMAACLAHEIRNPLGAIKGLAQLLNESMKEEEKNSAYTKTIIKEIDRLNEVVTHLLEFSQPETGGTQLCNVNEMIKQALLLTNVQAGKSNLVIEKHLSSTLPELWGDSRKLVQAFLNLLLNATHAAGNEGTLRVYSEKLEMESTGDSFIRVRIANNGAPLDPELGDRIFDPFFTTKKDGTGLGLAISHQIVSQHEGKISVESVEGFTVFSVDLPVSHSQKSQPPAPEMVAGR